MSMIMDGSDLIPWVFGQEAISSICCKQIASLSLAGQSFYRVAGPCYHLFAKGVVAVRGSNGLLAVLGDSFNWAEASLMSQDQAVFQHDFDEASILDIEGPCVSLSTPWSMNFFHWCEELAKAIWIESHGIHPRYIVPSNASMYGDSLRFFGIPSDRIVPVNGKVLRFNEFVLCPQFRFGRSQCQSAIVQLRSAAQERVPFDPSLNPRLLLMRSRNAMTFSNRQIMNIEETYDFCLKNDVDIIDPSNLPFEQQVACLRSRRVLAGVHGAGFCHQLWMESQSCILEAFSPHYINFTTFALSKSLDHTYFMFLSDNFYKKNIGNEAGEVILNIELLGSLFKSCAVMLAHRALR